MKKIIHVFAAGLLLVGLCGCNAKSELSSEDTDITDAKVETEPISEIESVTLSGSETEEVTEIEQPSTTEEQSIPALDFYGEEKSIDATPLDDYEYIESNGYIELHKYIGNDEFVVVPYDYDGIPVCVYDNLFIGTDVKYIYFDYELSYFNLLGYDSQKGNYGEYLLASSKIPYWTGSDNGQKAVCVYAPTDVLYTVIGDEACPNDPNTLGVIPQGYFNQGIIPTSILGKNVVYVGYNFGLNYDTLNIPQKLYLPDSIEYIAFNELGYFNVSLYCDNTGYIAEYAEQFGYECIVKDGTHIASKYTHCNDAGCGEFFETNGKTYCEQHMCHAEECDGSAYGENGLYCYEHTCDYDECPNQRVEGMECCEEHRCKSTLGSGCNKTRIYENDYCSEHSYLAG